MFLLFELVLAGVKLRIREEGGYLGLEFDDSEFLRFDLGVELGGNQDLVLEATRTEGLAVDGWGVHGEDPTPLGGWSGQFPEAGVSEEQLGWK